MKGLVNKNLVYNQKVRIIDTEIYAKKAKTRLIASLLLLAPNIGHVMEFEYKETSN